jgi:hypothetical protein
MKTRNQIISGEHGLYGGKYKRFESEIPIEFRVIGC